MVFGIHLIFALLAGCAAWLVGLLCGRLGAAGWLTAILTGATLVYVFWWLTALGPVTIGR